MSLTALLDADCRQAVELAKRWLPPDAKLDVETLLRALLHSPPLEKRAEFRELADLLPVPTATPRPEPIKVPVAEELRAALQALPGPGPITPLQLFAVLARTSTGRQRLPAAVLAKALQAAGTAAELPHDDAPSPPPASSSRFQALRAFGRLLTDPSVPLPQGGPALHDRALRVLMLQMLTPRYRNAVLVGPPGVGKTSLVLALAARLRQRDPQLPAPLREVEVLELSPAFPYAPPKSGGAPVSDVQQLYTLLRALDAEPGIVLYIDKLWSFLYLLSRVGAEQGLLSWFSQMLDSGAVGCLGSLNPREWSQLNELFPSLLRRFRVLQLEPPSGAALDGLVRERAGELQRHFHLNVPPSLASRAIALTDQHLNDRIQPEKSLRLLEAACGRALLESASELREDHLLQAVEDFVGPVLLARQPLSVAEVYQHLRSALVGQDDNLRKLSELVVAGRADRGWFLRPGPRGVFLFGGPTGTGKTETALQLGRLLGQGREAIVRVDCQNLQGSGTGHEALPMTWRLLGVAPGYVGHTPGCRDGLLVRVRDFPESVLLLDEFEKADASVGRLFLRILDEGKAEDSEGHELDFRRCFIILTSNAGVTYSSGHSFGLRPVQAGPPSASREAIHAELRAGGLGQEFLARIHHIFLFQGLRPEHYGEIIERQLAQLDEGVRARGKKLEWSPAVVNWLAEQSRNQANLGVRYILSLVRVAILDPLNMAVQAGEVDDSVRTIELVAPDGADGGAEHRRQGDHLRLPIHPLR